MEKFFLCCPKCHEYLVKGELQEFETLIDHVSNPNRQSYPLRPTWVCKNDNCKASMENLFWDDDGEMYGWNKTFKFKNDISSAYPSHSRKCDIEIYKKGLKKQNYLSPALMLWLLQPMIEYNYKADDYGNVIKKSWKLKWLKKDRWYNKYDTYSTYYTFPLVHIYSSIKSNRHMFKTCSETYIKHELKTMFEPIKSWDKRWWRHFELWLSKIIFRKYYKKSIHYVKWSLNIVD